MRRADDGDPTGLIGPDSIGERIAIANNAVRERFLAGTIDAAHVRRRQAAYDRLQTRAARYQIRTLRARPDAHRTA